MLNISCKLGLSPKTLVFYRFFYGNIHKAKGDQFSDKLVILLYKSTFESYSFLIFNGGYYFFGPNLTGTCIPCIYPIKFY